ncbi:MAG: hypothetical protein KDA96_06660, partial [Planctomycetaceae bacterium]|nr:hypothetical protein [Planctomycetaceae bacterium]
TRHSARDRCRRYRRLWSNGSEVVSRDALATEEIASNNLLPNYQRSNNLPPTATRQCRDPWAGPGELSDPAYSLHSSAMA